MVYSTTVAYFATRLNGAPALNRSGATAVVPLSSEQMMNLQRLLIKQGYDGVGEVDGKFGAGTRAAVKKAQMKVGVPADSYPTAELIERLSAGRTSGSR
jgi:peptidoglycan hydrolase-like protein with peptidoglycan-binding domain